LNCGRGGADLASLLHTSSSIRYKLVFNIPAVFKSGISLVRLIAQTSSAMTGEEEQEVLNLVLNNPDKTGGSKRGGFTKLTPQPSRAILLLLESFKIHTRNFNIKERESAHFPDNPTSSLSLHQIPHH
jgi:hypothetical protein